MRIARTRTLTLTVSLFAAAALAPSSASAGQVVMTGHDADDHCSGGDDQCHFFRVATQFARQGAPNPDRRLLLLDCNGGVRNAVEDAYADDPPNRRVCPSDDPGAFNDINLTTKKFSAILVGSSCDDSDTDGIGDNTLNLTDDQADGCDDPGGSTPDSDLINDRKADIRRFFNNGGGLFVMSGGDNGDGDPSSGPDRYYNFLPIPAEGVAVNPPFCLTERGIDLGFHDQSCPNPDRHNGTHDDINCCETHNSFAEPPPGSALKVAERDTEGFAETLFARGQISGGGFVDKPRINVGGVPGGCVRSAFTINVRIDVQSLRNARVLLDGEQVKKSKDPSFKVRIRAGGLLSGRHKIKVIARSTDGSRSTQEESFRRCPRQPDFTGKR